MNENHPCGGKKADARVIFVIVVMLSLHRIDFSRRREIPASRISPI